MTCINENVTQAMGGLRECESPSLRYSKFMSVPAKEGNEKSKLIKDFVNYYNDNAHTNNRHDDFILRPKGAKTFVMKLSGRLIVNHSGGVLENCGLCLHPHFNYPYIPGAAVKGVARHAAWESWNEKMKMKTDDPAKKEIAEKIAATFGFPTGDKDLDAFLKKEVSPEKYGTETAPKCSAGTVAFLAATPFGDRAAMLRVDVCTCHHPKYYTTTLDHAWDFEDPNPQPFPAVDAGVGFCFCIVPLKTDADLDFAEKSLKDALTTNGIGAKTAAGYGWFEENKTLDKKLDILDAGPEVSKICEMKNSEIGDFLKKELSDAEKATFKSAADNFKPGQNNKIKDLYKKGKGLAYANIIAIFGEEEARERYGK